MAVLMAFVVGALYTASLYLMLRRSISKLIVGLVLLSHSANLLIFTAGGLTRGRPPLIAEGANVPVAPYADPLPQALILTAIVISFAVLSFSVVLLHRAHQTIGSDNLDDMRGTDR